MEVGWRKKEVRFTSKDTKDTKKDTKGARPWAMAILLPGPRLTPDCAFIGRLAQAYLNRRTNIALRMS